jgi:hypothetical protein
LGTLAKAPKEQAKRERHTTGGLSFNKCNRQFVQEETQQRKTRMTKTTEWTRKEGKGSEGGLNAKGRESYNKANPGKPGLMAPQPRGGPRKDSFFARMSGMPGPMTDDKGKPTRNALALKAWKC